MLKYSFFLIIFTSTAMTIARAQTTVYTLESVSHSQEETKSSPLDQRVETQIEQEEITQASPSSVDDLLRLNNSVTTSRGPRSFGEAPQVRGVDSGKVFIYVDGERQNFKTGHSTMMAFDVENIKRVSIHENSSDFSKTGTLTGGVIFETIDAKDIIAQGEQRGFQAKHQQNSANAEKITNIKNAYKQEDHSVLLSYSRKTADNLALSDGSELAYSAYTENNLMGKYQYKGLKLKFEYFNRVDQSPIDPALDPTDSPYEDRLTLLGESDLIKNTLALSYAGRRHRINIYRNALSLIKENRASKVSETRDIETLGGEFKTQINSWVFGSDVAVDNLNSKELGSEVQAYPRAQKSEFSTFLEKTFSFGNINLTPGFKATYFSLNLKDDSLSPQYGSYLTKKLQTKYEHSRLTVEANYTESVNTPKVQEVYPRGLHSQGDGLFVSDNYFIPNPNLKEESSSQKDIKLSYMAQGFSDYDMFSFSFTFFENDIENYIYTQRIDRFPEDGLGTTQFANIPNVRLHGQNIEIGYLYDQIEFKLGYSQIRGRVKSSLDNNGAFGRYLADLPADTYSYNLNYTMEDQGLSFGYLGIQAQNQNRVNPETLERTLPTPGYFIHNVFINQRVLSNWYASLRVDNLGNQKYRRHGSHLFESKEDIKVALKYSL